METAKLFKHGGSQAVRLPKSCYFDCGEVAVKKVGAIVILYSKDDAWENFLACEPASDDFGDAVFESRREVKQSPREEMF
ncbi:MAG: type II toxin-antitoxin system VapB family antitoxin [Oscillospiraceae bacterium]|nr:type II toxin-antitoxin system VapB family antitoxin [Oscillospiraceae bacterium]